MIVLDKRNLPLSLSLSVALSFCSPIYEQDFLPQRGTKNFGCYSQGDCARLRRWRIGRAQSHTGRSSPMDVLLPFPFFFD